VEFKGRETVICGRFMKTGNASSALCVALAGFEGLLSVTRGADECIITHKGVLQASEKSLLLLCNAGESFTLQEIPY